MGYSLGCEKIDQNFISKVKKVIEDHQENKQQEEAKYSFFLNHNI